MKKLGIIGGLGPMATAYFLRLVTQMSDAGKDQDHIEIILHSRPQIPDRTKYILGESAQSPLPEIMEVGKGLVSQGAELITIPCITAHFFRKQLEEEIGVPVVDAIEETILYLEAAGITKVGIMATDGTMKGGLFQRSLARHKMDFVVPDQEAQKLLMSLIYEEIKAGKPMDFSVFWNVSRRLFQQQAQVVLLACTELSLFKGEYSVGAGILDVMDVLARKAVLLCGCLKEEYENLITE